MSHGYGIAAAGYQTVLTVELALPCDQQTVLQVEHPTAERQRISVCCGQISTR